MNHSKEKTNDHSVMQISLLFGLLSLICKDFSSEVIRNSSKSCIMSMHTDGCGNRGLMWQCGNRNLSEIPEHIPLKYKGEFVTLDLSENQFTRIAMETFHNIDPRVRSRITSISLRNNPIRHIGNFSFQCLWRLCELDLSTCHLHRTSFEINSFVNSLLNQLKILRLHNNSFRGNGYPDIAISKAKLLENLTLDVFGGFTFSSYFQNLTKLKKIEFITGNSKFHLTNSTFRGLIKSPIVNLEMIFKFRVYSDVSDDIFCSFPFLKAVHIEFGGMCDLNVVLKSLKCLQNRTMDRIIAYNNNPMIAKNAVYLDNENCKYLFNICSRRVELVKNRIVGIYDNLLSTVMGQCMEYFDVSSNRIRVINPWYMLDFLTRYPNRQVFNFSSNADQCNCESPRYSHRPTLGALRMIDCENDKFSQIASNMFVSNVSGKTYLKKRGLMAFKISEKIRVLHFSKNYLNRLTYPLPFDISLNAMNLKELYVVRTNFPCKYMAPIQTPFLEILDISNNDCSEMKMRILMFAKKLRIFVASNINLSFAGSLKYGKLFRGVMSLCKVDLSRNSLTYLPPAMFKDQEKSLLTANFDSNLFSTIPVSNLRNLTRLYLRHNKIPFFMRTDFEKISTLGKSVVFIEGNPINCECTNILSLKWMKESSHRFGDLNKTLCINKKVLLSNFFQEQTFKKFELICQSDVWLLGSSFALVFVIIILLTTAAIKRYRVHVDYIILRMRSRWKGVMCLANSEKFRFDAFVTYTEEDYQLACITFYQTLVSLGFKISMPDKDFLPGISKAKQLLQCIDQSRKVVIIVTENFLENGWNSYAVQMVVTHAFHNQRERSIIVIIKDDISLERLPRDLKYIWWSIVSIRWPNGDETMDKFWEEICAALRPDP